MFEFEYHCLNFKFKLDVVWFQFSDKGYYLYFWVFSTNYNYNHFLTSISANKTLKTRNSIIAPQTDIYDKAFWSNQISPHKFDLYPQVIIQSYISLQDKNMIKCIYRKVASSRQFECKWAGLAVLFSRQLPKGSHNVFQIFRIFFLNYFMKNPQTTIAPTFLTHIISAIDGVKGKFDPYVL